MQNYQYHLLAINGSTMANFPIFSHSWTYHNAFNFFQPFSEITELTDVQEGIIVRTIQRLDEVLKDVRNAAVVIGDPILKSKMEESSMLIKRDIVFAASLYTQWF